MDGAARTANRNRGQAVEELNRCRAYLKICLELLSTQPRLLLISACSIVPIGVIAWFLIGIIRHPAIPSWGAAVALALSMGLLTWIRIGFSRAVFTELLGQPWTLRGCFLFSRQRWKAALLFGLLDTLASALSGYLLIYFVFGSVAAGFWWSMAALVPCALAAGFAELDRAMVRAERVLSMVRFELVFASSILNLIWNLLLQLAMGLSPTPALATFLFIVIAIPAREVLWQLFVCVVYYHTVQVAE